MERRRRANEKVERRENKEIHGVREERRRRERLLRGGRDDGRTRPTD